MTTHKLKIWPEYYEAVSDGSKRFELREDDRGFRVGDTLHLCEWKPSHRDGGFTGRELTCRVTYKLHVAMSGPGTGDAPRYVVMSIADVNQVKP